MTEKFTMRRPDDFHLHLRSGKMLQAVLPYTEQQFGRAIIMPNLAQPGPVLNAQDMRAYRKEIFAASTTRKFEPLMTIQVIEGTTPETIFDAKDAGAIAGKIYPRGMTTNSENGVFDYKKIYPVLEAMQKCGMLALFHGESPFPDHFCLDREVAFLSTLENIANSFPALKIVMEHVTTRRAVDCVSALPDMVAATITVHHLSLTLNDVIGDKLKPHNFCKPVAKRALDRDTLLVASMSGNPKFFLGTDSAPHLKGAKECADGCAGVYTAPIAVPRLVEIFEREGRLSRLEDFGSTFGADFYGLARNRDTISLVKEPWIVPAEYDGVVPFRAGEELQWRME